MQNYGNYQWALEKIVKGEWQYVPTRNTRRKAEAEGAKRKAQTRVVRYVRALSGNFVRTQRGR